MERSACQGHVCAVLEQRDGQPVLRITNQWDRLQANSITQVVFDGTALDDLCDVLLKLKAEMAPAEEQSVREYVDERDLGREDPFGNEQPVPEGSCLLCGRPGLVGTEYANHVCRSCTEEGATEIPRNYGEREDDYPPEWIEGRTKHEG